MCNEYNLLLIRNRREEDFWKRNFLEMVHSEKMAGLYLLYGHYFGLQHSLKDYKKPWKKWRKNCEGIYKEEFDSVALIKGTFWSLSGSFHYGASKGSKSHLSVGNIWLILSIPGTEPPHSWSKWQKPARNEIKQIWKIHSWVWQILIMKHVHLPEMQKDALV